MTPIVPNQDFIQPSDGWYQIEVPGEHLNKKSGIVQVIDDASVESIVNRFNQEADDYARNTGRPFPGMLIDIEHFKHDSKKETRAYGWLLVMQNRNGLPFGKIRWTRTGKQAVDGGEYRFFSTEYDPNDLTVLNSTKPQRVRPMRLDGLTLTNDPNNKGGLPITNRATEAIEVPLHHPFATDEEYIAMVKKNREQIAANIAAEEKAKAAAERSKKQAEADAVKLVRPHFERWLDAVNKIQETGQSRGVKFHFDHAWDLAKTQYPDLYAKAFEDPEANVVTATNENAAAHLIGEIANRVRSARGGDFRHAWQFVEKELPDLYKRLTPLSERMTNRAHAQDAAVIQNKAQRFFNNLVRHEEISARTTFGRAFRAVMDREPVLADLANGKISPAQAQDIQPGILKQL